MKRKEEGLSISTDGIDQLMKALKDKPPIARIGILGGKAARQDVGPSNADIGATHEFGTAKLPARSFLRIPLMEKLQKALDKSGAFDQKSLNEVMKAKSLRPWVEKLAILGEAIVLGSFETGGYGKWPSSNMTHKKNAQTLVETGQLRDSITSEVVG